MFQSRKNLSPNKIQLPRRTSPPSKDFLFHLFSQATEFKGKEVEVSWPNSMGTLLYGLTVRAEPQSDRVSWLIWQEDGKETSLMWQCKTNDINLITDVVYKLEAGIPIRSQPASQDSPLYGQPGSDLLSGEPYGGIRGPGSSLRLIEPRNILTGQQASTPYQSENQNQQIPNSGQDEQQSSRSNESTSANNFSQQNHDINDDTPSAKAARQISNSLKTFSSTNLKELRISSDSTLSGDLGQIPTSALFKAVAAAKCTGKLDLITEESTGSVYFLGGKAEHASCNRNAGDIALCELVSWQKCLFKFVVNDYTAVQSVQKSLEQNIMDGNALLDQRKHLERAGLTYESILAKKHKHLSDAELRVFLTKASNIDLDLQVKIYKAIGARCTLFDLLRDHPMESFLWVPVLFNFITCELIEIKPPSAELVDIFDFLGDGKVEVDTIASSLLRPETGILSYASFLYFLRNEFFRFEAYGWPLTIVLFDLTKRSIQFEGKIELLAPRELLVAIQRIELVKRSLDLVCHFETAGYALLLPNTTASSGAYVANRIWQTLTAAPLSTSLDKKHLRVAFGIASVPTDADNLEQLLNSGKDALNRARDGDFPVIVAHRQK